MGRVETFKYKLAGMRKADDFIVYPRTPEGDPDLLKVQGDRSIAIFNIKTRQGLLNWKGNGSKYNPHLSPALGAEPFTFPKEFVGLAVEFCPSSGDRIGQNVYLA